MSSSSPQTLNDNDHQSSYSSEQQQSNNMNGANNNGGGGGGVGGSSMNNNNNNNNNNETSIKNELNESITVSNSNENNTNNNNNNSQDDVCRDFLRNVCRRGKSCRYKHPDGSDPELLKNKEQFVFCHDFQNRECRRDNCRFLHCTKQEEEMYRSTGRLPPHIQAQIQNDDRLSAPICKDFLHGTCRRGHRCKYRHPDYHSSNNRNGPPVQSPFDGRNGGRGGGGNYPMSNNSHNPMDYQSPYGGSGGRGSQMMPSSNYGYNDNYTDTPTNKRKRYDPGNIYHENSGPYPGAYNEPPPNMRGTQSGYGVNSPSQPYYGAPRATPIESRYLEEENAALRRRIDDLKKQLSEYMSTNEYLLEQLNQYRASNSAATSLQQQQPPPGSVASTGTITQMSAPITLQTAQVTPQQAAAVAIGPLPPVSIVSSIASISLPTVSAPVTLVNSSAAASLASFTPSMHSSNPWPLGVDQ